MLPRRSQGAWWEGTKEEQQCTRIPGRRRLLTRQSTILQSLILQPECQDVRKTHQACVKSIFRTEDHKAEDANTASSVILWVSCGMFGFIIETRKWEERRCSETQNHFLNMSQMSRCRKVLGRPVLYISIILQKRYKGTNKEIVK